MDKKIAVYRGGRINPNEFKEFYKYKQKAENNCIFKAKESVFVEVNSFLSTSKNPNKAWEFANSRYTAD